MANDDRAIIVGVQTYPELGDLGGPENDARAFAQWVLSDSGGAVPDANIKLILSSQYHPPFLAPAHAKPITQDVQDLFDELQNIADDNDKKGLGLRVGRRLYIYLAGHGFAPRADQTALLMANATRLRVGYHILGKYLADWFRLAGYFDEILLFMDCCREIYPLAPLNLPPYTEIRDPDAIDRVKYFHGFGTKWSRLSRERPMDNGLVRGVFTTALLKGLTGAASDPSGQVTAASLTDYLYNNMKTFLAPEDLTNSEVPKEPEVDYYPKAGAAFVIVTVPVPTFPVKIHLPPGPPGVQVTILGDKFQPVRQDQVATSTWELSLPRGTYLVQAGPGIPPKVMEVSGSTGVTDVQF